MEGMGVLLYLEVRLQSDSGNINYSGFKADATSNAYVDFITKRGSMEAAALAMAGDIKAVLATGQLSAGEISQLQGVMEGLTGSAELATKYVGQAVSGADAGIVLAGDGNVALDDGNIVPLDETNPDIDMSAQNADNLTNESNSIDYGLVKEYVKDIEERTGIRLHEKQIGELKKALRSKEYKRLSPMENSQHRSEFKKIKNDLILEWEENTGQKWPVYEENIISVKTGEPSRRVGSYYDAHHIIESSFGGDNAWWNIHPARFPDIHQLGIHGVGSPASRLFFGGNND